ncbi:hypothetical protein ACIBF7_42985 [Nonomuraea sp. NPDC050478]
MATAATSREVAAHLFLSPRTVEARLRWASPPAGSSENCRFP